MLVLYLLFNISGLTRLDIRQAFGLGLYVFGYIEVECRWKKMVGNVLLLANDAKHDIEQFVLKQVDSHQSSTLYIKGHLIHTE
jgi:hypothetical protein